MADELRPATDVSSNLINFDIDEVSMKDCIYGTTTDDVFCSYLSAGLSMPLMKSDLLSLTGAR